jgi:hypothetical protein
MKMKFTHTTALLVFAVSACAAPPQPVPAQDPFAAEPVPAIQPPPAAPAFPAPAALAVEPAFVVAQATPVSPKPMKGDFLFSQGRGGRTLIIQSSDPDPKTYANLEEDLNIMYRILSKTRKQDENGFKLESIFQGSSSSVKSMYIEGYGAVFMLGVRFPLVAPRTSEEQPKPKDTTSEEWEGARKELYARNTLELDFDHIWGKAISSQAEEYDAGKVEDLTQGILEALKNGTHIRHLKSDEFVTVAVLGAPSGTVRAVMEKDEHDGGAKRKERVESVRSGSGVGESTMTIRAKKSDIDDFAKGKLNLDAFRKKAKMLVYLRPVDSAGKMAIFPSPGQPGQRP